MTNHPKKNMRVTAERVLRNGVWRIQCRVTRGMELVVQTTFSLERFNASTFWRTVFIASQEA